MFFLYRWAIAWQSAMQRVVALSSCEADYIAPAGAVCEGVWLALLLAELIGRKILAPKLKVDNKSALALMNNPVHHDRSKHIDIKFHFFQECCDNKLIDVEFIGIELQPRFTLPVAKKYRRSSINGFIGKFLGQK